MKYKNSFLGLVATAALISSSGCSKQEASSPPAVEKTSSARPNTEKPQPAETTAKATAVEAAAPPKTESVAATKPPPAPVAPAAPAAPEPAKAPAVVESKGPNASASLLQSSFQAQKLPLGQAATNQAQALAVAATNQVLAALGSTNQTPGTVTNPLPGIATAATNQWQALATGASNRVLAALGITNQTTTTATNQVEALLEKAKSLSDNQKYQEALSTVTQLYNTKLTPEQKLKADELKAQIQAQLTQKATSEASSVLGGLLGGKK